MSETEKPLLLQARGLVKHLGGRRVVDGVNLSCHGGQVLGLLGANGAGKSTSLRMCYGMLRCDAGSIHIAGHDLSAEPDLARRQLGVCSQDDTFDADFSVRDNLLNMANYFRPKPADLLARVEELLDLFALRPFANAKPDTLSGGYRRRLGIARALVHRPQLVFLDEPTTGLDPEARMAVWDLVRLLRGQGLGIVLTTHYMDEAHRLSDSLVILDAGKIRAQGSASSVLGQLVGEHMVVIEGIEAGLLAQVEQWLRANKRPPAARMLDSWHFPLDGTGLAAFSLAFGEARFEVRSPTLDDLFLALGPKTDSPATSTAKGVAP